MTTKTVFTGSDLKDGDIKQFFKRFLQKETQKNSSLPRNETSDKDEYEFTHEFRGIAIVICNKKFDNLEPRPYADDEIDKMDTVFSGLGFMVMLFKNLTARQIYEVLYTASSSDLDFVHSKSDCFACVLASHGNEVEEDQTSNPKIFHHVIHGTDRAIRTHLLLDLFDNKSCRSLRDRPKLFFIQACRSRFNDEHHRRFDLGVIVSVKDTSAKKADLKIKDIKEGGEKNNEFSLPKHPDVHNHTENIAAFGGDNAHLTDITCSRDYPKPGEKSQADPEASDNTHIDRTSPIGKNVIPSLDVEITYEKDIVEEPSGFQRGIIWIKKYVCRLRDRKVPPANDSVSIEVVATPCHNDCLVMYSTSQGKAGFGRDDVGGWMLFGLFKVMERYLDFIKKDDKNCLDFLSLMTTVMRAVAFQMETNTGNPNTSGMKTAPTLQHKFCKDVKFRNKLKK